MENYGDRMSKNADTERLLKPSEDISMVKVREPALKIAHSFPMADAEAAGLNICEKTLTLLPRKRSKNMERRKFTRFRAHDNGYAALKGDFTRVGKISDISLNGLSFKYLSKAVQEEEFSRADIFLIESKFHLRNIPCRLVYQIPDKSGKGLLVQTYRCGLHFKELAPSQLEQLELFIENYTIGVLES